jgi:hypothetical protein
VINTIAERQQQEMLASKSFFFFLDFNLKFFGNLSGQENILHTTCTASNLLNLSFNLISPVLWLPFLLSIFKSFYLLFLCTFILFLLLFFFHLKFYFNFFFIFFFITFYLIPLTYHRGEIRNLGKPVALCKQYFDGGADEVVFLNITSFRQG